MAKKTDVTKKEVTIKWILTDKQIVKFIEEPEDTYDLADNVMDYVADIKENDKVNVSIDNKSNKVVFIGKVKAEKKKKETPKAEGEAKDWTVKAITTKKDVVKFEEGTENWYIIPKELRDQFKDVKAKDVLKVVIGTAKEKGKEKPAVVSVETTVKESTTSTSSSYNETTNWGDAKTDTNNSIERQVALKEAGAIIRELIKQNKAVDINEYKAWTKAGLEAMYQ